MNRKVIKIIVIVAIAALLVGGGIWLGVSRHSGPIVGRIEFGQAYYMSDVRPQAFENVHVDPASYWQINADKQTGVLHLVGLASGDIKFIVTSYQEGTTNTTINFEFIYRNELVKFAAISTNTTITVKNISRYRVDITQENPDDTTYIDYNSTILKFKREVTNA